MKPRTNALRGFCGHKSPLKQSEVDLTKKSGFGPLEILEDDQSRKAQTIKYEQGNSLGIENPVALEKLYEKTENPNKKPRQ